MRLIRSYTKPQQESVQQLAKITRLCLRDSNAILLVFNLFPCISKSCFENLASKGGSLVCFHHWQYQLEDLWQLTIQHW